MQESLCRAVSCCLFCDPGFLSLLSTAMSRPCHAESADGREAEWSMLGRGQTPESSAGISGFYSPLREKKSNWDHQGISVVGHQKCPGTSSVTKEHFLLSHHTGSRARPRHDCLAALNPIPLVWMALTPLSSDALQLKCECFVVHQKRQRTVIKSLQFCERLRFALRRAVKIG